MDFLAHTVVAAAVEQLVNGSTTHLILVTPYFKPWDRIAKAILGAKARGVKVTLLLRGGPDQPKQEANAKPFVAAGCMVVYLDRLHAKIYISDREAILTSMNLYEDSAVNSYEAAVRFGKEADEPHYKSVATQMAVLLRQAEQDAKVAALKAPPATATSEEATVRLNRLKYGTGHCIRCAATIPNNVGHPLCATCFASWSRFSNADYEESYCHGCGAEKSTSFAKPLCKKCWQARA
jgi:phosphatidylserine/phosphatidylglycerophosphate/cardiolipin synthase-like enzyme